MTPELLGDLTHLVRSKNAGPFVVTVDAFFSDFATYDDVKRRGLLNKTSVAEAYGIDEESIIGIYYWDHAAAVKVAMLRAISAGGVGDEDCYGAAQHVPLMTMRLGVGSVRERHDVPEGVA